MNAITAKEYARKIGYDPTSITKALKKMTVPALPLTDSVTKVGNSWVIVLSAGFKKAEAKKLFSEIEK